jgi:hypothetical protein
MKLDFPIDNLEILIKIIGVHLEEGIVLNQDEFQFEVGKVGVFKVLEGKKILFQPVADFDQHLARIYLNGSVFAAVLHQRKLLPMHASSFEINGAAVFICGESEAGKSTIAYNFYKRGFPILSDDVSPVFVSDNRVVTRGYSQKVKLWDDALANFKISSDGLQQIWEGDEKYYLDVESIELELEPKYIFEVFIGEKLEIKTILNADKFELIHRNIFRREYLEGMPETSFSYVKQIASLARQCSVFRIERPYNIDVDLVCDLILSRILNH